MIEKKYKVKRPIIAQTSQGNLNYDSKEITK